MKLVGFQKYFTKYFMKYFTPINFMKFYITRHQVAGRSL